MEQIKSRRSYHLPICRGMLLLSVLGNRQRYENDDEFDSVCDSVCMSINKFKYIIIAKPNQSKAILFTSLHHLSACLTVVTHCYVLDFLTKNEIGIELQ